MFLIEKFSSLGKVERAIIFFVGVIFILLSIIYFIKSSRGEILIEGDFPFKVNPTPGKEFWCENKKECTIESDIRSFEIEVIKDGFYPYRTFVKLERGEKRKVQTKFIFKPRIEQIDIKIEKINIPNEKRANIFADNQNQMGIKFFTQENKFNTNKLPNIVDKIIFSNFGKHAIVATSKKKFIWNEDIKELKFLQDIISFSFSSENKLIFWNDEKISIFDPIAEILKEEKLKAITRGKIDKVFLSPKKSDFYFTVKKGKDYTLHFFNTETKKDIVLYDFTDRPMKMKISNSNKALLKTKDNKVYIINEKAQKEIKEGFEIELEKAIWQKEGKLLLASIIPEESLAGNSDESLLNVKNYFSKNLYTFFLYDIETRQIEPFAPAKFEDEKLKPKDFLWENEEMKSIIFRDEKKFYRLILEIEN